MFFSKLKNILGNKFVVNTSWMMGERTFQMVVSFVVGLMTARYLGPTNFGIINYVASFVAFATPICNLGLESIIVNKIINNPHKEREIIGTAIYMQFLASLISSIIIVLIITISNAADPIKMIVAGLQSLSLLFKSTESIEFWYQSRLKSKIPSIIKMVAYSIMTAYRIFLLVTSRSVEWFAFAITLDAIIITILYLFCYPRHSKNKFRINLTLGKDMLRESYHFILSGLMVVIYSQMDKVMIQAILGDRFVGLYSAAFTIATLWFLVPTAIIISARPIIMKLKTQNEDLYIKRLKQVYASIFWIGLVFCALFTVLSNDVMMLLYGTDYSDASSTLAIILWFGIFAQLGNARGIWIVCENKNKFVKRYLFIGLIINLALNSILIPTIGINGAALATVATQVTTSLIAPLFYRETRVQTAIMLKGILFRWKM